MVLGNWSLVGCRCSSSVVRDALRLDCCSFLLLGVFCFLVACVLFIDVCPVFLGSCLLISDSYLSFEVCCLLFLAYGFVYIVHCLLRVVCRLLFDVCCVLFGLRCVLRVC